MSGIKKHKIKNQQSVCDTVALTHISEEGTSGTMMYYRFFDDASLRAELERQESLRNETEKILLMIPDKCEKEEPIPTEPLFDKMKRRHERLRKLLQMDLVTGYQKLDEHDCLPDKLHLPAEREIQDTFSQVELSYGIPVLHEKDVLLARSHEMEMLKIHRNFEKSTNKAKHKHDSRIGKQKTTLQFKSLPAKHARSYR